MNRFFLLIVCCALSLLGNAKCAGSGVSFWPANGTLKPNGILLVEFFGNSQRLADGLNKEYPVYLQWEGEKIPLKVMEVCRGEFLLTQVILRPQKDLVSGREYTFHAENVPKEERFATRWSIERKAHVPVTWKVEGEADGGLPEWKGKPVYGSTSFNAYGCGPARWVSFSVTASDASEVLVKTTVRSLATGKSTTVYLTTKEGKLDVGHGMCSGAFLFGEGKEYEAVFSLLDASGNAGCEQTTAVRFSRPEPTTREIG